MSGHHHSGGDARTSDGTLVAGDGTLLVVDCIDGLTLLTRERIREVLAMGFTPLLMLTNIHRCFLEKLDGEEAYQKFCTIINDVNAFIKLYSTHRLKDVEVSPREGTVVFYADSWGFSIPKFAEIYESKFGLDHDKVKNRLWGDNYYDPSTKIWTPTPTTTASCKRGFLLYVYDPIRKVLSRCLRDEKDKLQSMIQKLGGKTMDMRDLQGEGLFDLFMRSWLPTSNILREDPSYFNAEGSCWRSEDVNAVTKSYDKGHVALEEDKPANFCLMPKGSAKGLFTLPPEVLERLAPYQIRAVRWLWDLQCKSMGGILADDMGMGKTRTVCSFLRGLLSCSLIERAIIVAPKSVLSQWVAELKNVGLVEEIHMYRTPVSEGESLNSVIKRGGVLLTTYEVFRSKHKIIACEETKVIKWNYIFLDEGHRIKNDKTQTSQAFRALNCHNKIVITGTPFQNNLKELYVLVNFCCPNLLGNEQEFVEKFVEPIEKAKFSDSQLSHKRLAMSASEELKNILKPCMLRRTKRLLQAMGLLGSKHEMTVWLEMTTVQIDLYKALLTEIRLGNSKGASLAEASVAKNICNHPFILRKLESGDAKASFESQGLANNYKKQLLKLVPFPDVLIGSSCKLRFILYLVNNLLAEHHKILVFSQSVPMLQLVEQALLTFMDESKIIRMDGSTTQPERDEKIKSFQANIENPDEISPEDVPDVFLMTTSVGGMGLNLTAGSRVIIVDPAQNPSMDNQSVDRAFRLGQKKDVIVYRLITAGTIEEHTYRRQVIKGEISTSVTEKEQCARALEKETGKVLSLPKGGFAKSWTHQELLESYQTRFDESILEHLEFIMRETVVVGLNNHGSLFSVEECLPLPCDDDSPVKLARRFRKKFASDTVIGGEKYAYHVKDPKWGVQNKMLAAAAGRYRKLLPQKLYGPEKSGGSSRPEAGGWRARGGMNPGATLGDDPPKEPDAATGPG